MVTLSLREQGRRTTWHALQTAAVALAIERPFDTITVDEIAARAGVSRRTFFNHFQTKVGALFDPNPEDAERLAELLAAADVSLPLWNNLRAICVDFVAGHEDVIAIRRRLVSDAPPLDHYHRAAHQHVEDALLAWSSEAYPDTPFHAQLCAHSAAAILVTAFARWRPDDATSLLPILVDQGFGQLGKGLSPGRSAEPS
jgi:AcrR family transcriptional regulator